MENDTPSSNGRSGVCSSGRITRRFKRPSSDCGGPFSYVFPWPNTVVTLWMVWLRLGNLHHLGSDKGASMEDLQERVAWLEKVVAELAKVVYAHAGTIAETKRDFGVHYHMKDGRTTPAILRTGDPLRKLVTQVSVASNAIDHDPTPEIQEYERDPQAFLKSAYSSLFYWPWE